MRPRFGTSLGSALLAAVLAAPLAVAAENPGRLLGTFRLTYYFVAEEKHPGDWPLFAPACSGILAFTSR